MAQSFVICFFLTLTSAFKVYDLNLSLTDGGPYGTTKMAAMTIFEKAFTSHNYGLGSGRGNHFLPDHIGSSYYSSWFQENVRRWKHENEYCKKDWSNKRVAKDIGKTVAAFVLFLLYMIPFLLVIINSLKRKISIVKTHYLWLMTKVFNL